MLHNKTYYPICPIKAVRNDAIKEANLKEGEIVVASPIGEIRKPCKGEWYLSEELAYKAYEDLTEEFELCRITKV